VAAAVQKILRRNRGRALAVTLDHAVNRVHPIADQQTDESAGEDVERIVDGGVNAGKAENRGDAEHPPFGARVKLKDEHGGAERVGSVRRHERLGGFDADEGVEGVQGFKGAAGAHAADQRFENARGDLIGENDGGDEQQQQGAAAFAAFPGEEDDADENERRQVFLFGNERHHSIKHRIAEGFIEKK